MDEPYMGIQSIADKLLIALTIMPGVYRCVWLYRSFPPGTTLVYLRHTFPKRADEKFDSVIHPFWDHEDSSIQLFTRLERYENEV